jgi:predicted Fe-S protein YdhL (DUF1289 family)
MIKVTATLEKSKQFYSATGSYFVFMSSPIPPPPAAPRSIATPCVKLCVVDGATSLCLGCWRTLSEIGGWSGFTDAERAAIMAALPAREARGG